MYAININGTINYRRCQQAQARKSVAEMSNEEKQRLLNTIKIHQGVCNLTDQQYDTKMLQYIEKLLKEVEL